MTRRIVTMCVLFAVASLEIQAAARKGLWDAVGAPILRQTIPPADSQAKLPAGLTLVDWKQIKAEYERHRHGMFLNGKGGYQSRSHYHGWLSRFDGKGFTVQPGSESWSWGLELVSWGREDHEASVKGATENNDGVVRIASRGGVVGVCRRDALLD